MDLCQQSLDLFAVALAFGRAAKHFLVVGSDLVQDDLVGSVNRHLALVNSFFHRRELQLASLLLLVSRFALHETGFSSFLHLGLSALGDFLLLPPTQLGLRLFSYIILVLVSSASKVLLQLEPDFLLLHESFVVFKLFTLAEVGSDLI